MTRRALRQENLGKALADWAPEAETPWRRDMSTMPSQALPDLYDRLDPGIRETVRTLRENGIETTESCEGTRGHCYAEPTVCFDGGYEAGFRALALCFSYALPVASLQRYWTINSGEVTGPEWRLTFYHKDGGGLHPIIEPDGMSWRSEWGPPQTQENGAVGSHG